MKKINIKFWSLALIAMALIVLSKHSIAYNPTHLESLYLSLCVLPTSGSTVYAGSESGLLKSVNNGTSFTEVLALTNKGVKALAYDANSNVLYVGTTEGLYFSNNTQTTFTLWSEGTNYEISAIAVVSTGLYAGRVLANHGNNTIKFSDNGGITWNNLPTQGLPNSYTLDQIIDNGTHLIITTKTNFSNAGIYYSGDGGSTWLTIPLTGIAGTSRFWDLSYSNTPDVRIYALTAPYNVYTTKYINNNWDIWSFISNGIPTGNHMESVFGNNVGVNRVLIGTGGFGLYESDNFGGSWSNITPNIENGRIRDISRNNNRTFIATYGAFIWYSEPPRNNEGGDNSVDWVKSTITTWNPPRWPVINAHTISQDIWFVSTAIGITTTTNLGDSWNSLNNGLVSTFVNCLQFHNGFLYAATRGGVHRSSNTGINWSLSNSGISDSVINTMERNSTGSILFAGTDSKGVYSSTNNGVSWTSAGLANTKIRKLFYYGTDMYAATENGVYKTSNSGAVWIIELSDSSINSFAVRGSKIYSGSGNTGMYSQHIDSNVWVTFNDGLASNKINAILSKNGVLYAATNDSGLYMASSNTWQRADQNFGIFSRSLTTLTGDSTNIYISDKYGLIYYGPYGGSANVLNLTAFIEGLYDPSNDIMISDTTRVYLRNIGSPYAIVDSAKAVLGTSGIGTFNFSNAVNGTNYYIVIKHRNSIETWSANPVAMTALPILYDFTTSLSQAYGNNMIQVDASPVRFAIYGGDVNGDGIIDLLDLGLVDNDAYNFVFGYVNTDVTGDGFVDASDISIIDNNAYNFVIVVRP